MSPHAAVDDGRAAVYAAELAAFDGTSYESVVPFEHLVELAHLATAAVWWPSGPIGVRRARADAGSSSARQRGANVPEVRLAEPQMTPATLSHELAHVVAGISAWHGPRFRRAHLDLVGFLFGADERGWLFEAYATMGLPVGARHWPAPSVRGRGAIAL